MEKRRVVVDGSVYVFAPSGGAFGYLNELLPRLTNETFSIELYTPGKAVEGVPQEATQMASVPALSWFPQGRVKEILRPVKRQLERLLLSRGSKPALYHSVWYYPYPDASVPMVTVVHDLIPERFPELYSQKTTAQYQGQKKKNLKAAKRFIAISECTKKDLMDVFSIPEKSIDVIYHGVNHTIFNSHSQSQQKKMAQPYFLYVGGRLNHKNFMRLLEAYAVSHVNRDYQLAVIGTPWNNEELELLQKWGVEKKVVNLGYATNTELAELYRGTTAFLMPSLYEGFGMPIVEAMASGAPMGLSSTGPMPEIGGDAALYFDPKDPAKIASVLEALTDEATRSKLKSIGLKRAGGFSWEKAARETLESYKRTLS